MKQLIVLLAITLAMPVAGRSLKLRTSGQIVSQATPKPAAVACRSVDELRQALGADFASAEKFWLLKGIDFKKQMFLVIRAGRVNSFGVQLSLLKMEQPKAGGATVHWQYKPYFGGAAPPNQPGNPTLIALVNRIDGPVKFQRKNWQYPKGLPLPPSAPPSRPPGLPRK